ncbi:MAG: preprotein translocase subunit YajC [Bacteroidales bacterium]|nr:preprotein translocase subunit YajC [Bacteroidales bacterium]MDD6494140.1 preprotein translocase subunit YajC [Bacteroidales bacterium]MDY4926087.1 preprotein translocase subunit YajC [Prevotella sp.]MDY5033653.1 preprotein translocase subunit YajC [Prevotella sp.]
MTLTVLAAQAAGGGGTSMIIMLVVMFAIMYFFMIRPQQKKQKEIRNFQNSLKVGQKVVTGGGVHGEVKKVELAEPLVEIEVAKGVVIKVEKSYVFAAAPEQK